MDETHWHDVGEEKPRKSGIYTVRDRKGRVFRTWYEATRGGFCSVYKGVGYTITHWKKADEEYPAADAM